MSKLVYANYKEPLRKTSTGYGYYGTVAETEDGEAIQCYECGKLFRIITNAHLKTHKMNPREYRDKFKLGYSTPLACRAVRERCSVIYRKNISIEARRKAIEGLMQYRKDVRNGKRAYVRPEKGDTLERQNKKGTCPDQLLEKLKKMGDVSYRKLRSEDEAFLGNLVRRFGSLNEAKKMANIPIAGYSKIKYKDKFLLESLRNFYKIHKRTPVYSDFKSENGLGTYITYKNRWGDLNGARKAAGIPIVIKVGYQQWAEVMVSKEAK